VLSPCPAVLFLRTFAKVRKATINFSFLSVRPSVHLSSWNNWAPTERIYMKLCIWVFFKNLLRKFKFHENRTRITLYRETNVHFLSYLFQFFLEWEIFQTKFVGKIKTHVLC
jgi:hypothetical protein